MTAEEALKEMRATAEYLWSDQLDGRNRNARKLEASADALESALREKDERIAELEAQVAADFTTVAEMEAECNELRMRNPLRMP